MISDKIRSKTILWHHREHMMPFWVLPASALPPSFLLAFSINWVISRLWTTLQATDKPSLIGDFVRERTEPLNQSKTLKTVSLFHSSILTRLVVWLFFKVFLFFCFLCQSLKIRIRVCGAHGEPKLSSVLRFRLCHRERSLGRRRFDCDFFVKFFGSFKHGTFEQVI